MTAESAGRRREVVSRLVVDRRPQLLAALIVITIVMSVISPFFFRLDNLLSMTQYGVVVGVLAIGQALVILGGGGGIDLSVGGQLSFIGIVMAAMTMGGVSPWMAAGCAIVLGACIGAINATLIAIFKLPALIVTLGTQFLFASLALVVSAGNSIGVFSADGFPFLGQGGLIGIPVQVLLVLLPLFVVVIWIQSRTTLGQVLFQVGLNSRAASLVGVRPSTVRFFLYVISGVLAAVGAIVTNSWLQTASPTAGDGYELQSITVAVLGGISIAGGRGRLTGVLLALLIVVVLDSGLQLANVGNTVQGGILGIVLIIALLVNFILNRRTST
ncbi:MAG TPA: ABC transporter permease [Thermomicrobiales bacterium]|nr:ABC transporter permease [Thermomicrobiales bacterium]